MDGSEPSDGWSVTDNESPALKPGALEWRRLQRVLDFVEEHLNESLSIDELYARACLSKFHDELVRDVMVQTLSTRFGQVEQLPQPAQWLSDNGSGYIARETLEFARDIGLTACRTPYRSPQSNGMAEAFVKTFKRDYVSVNPTPDGPTVLEQLVKWFADYNEVHPHKALRLKSPREFIRSYLQPAAGPV